MPTNAREFLEKLDGPLTFGDALAALRETEEESLTAFAARLDISRQHLCDLEQGRRAVSLERAARFANALDQSERVFLRLALRRGARAVLVVNDGGPVVMQSMYFAIKLSAFVLVRVNEADSVAFSDFEFAGETL